MSVKRKRYALTLLEIMIVIFLIGLIGSVIGYNMKGSLDKGRVFKTEEAQARIREILMLELAQGNIKMDDALSHPAACLKSSGLVADADKMMRDGWGNEMRVEQDGPGEVRVISEGLDEYNKKKKKK